MSTKPRRGADPTPEPSPASENGVDRKVLNFRRSKGFELLIIALIIAANADFSFVVTRDEDEIGHREDEGKRPPDGSQEKTVRAGCDSVSRQRIL